MHNAIHNVIYVNNRRRVEVLYEPVKGQHVVLSISPTEIFLQRTVILNVKKRVF